jgi:hypothetical protein
MFAEGPPAHELWPFDYYVVGFVHLRSLFVNLCVGASVCLSTMISYQKLISKAKDCVVLPYRTDYKDAQMSKDTLNGRCLMRYNSTAMNAFH